MSELEEFEALYSSKGIPMNRTLLFGLAIFLAVVGITLLGSETNTAVAGHGCACACSCACDCGCGGCYCGCACGGRRMGLLARIRARRNACCAPSCCAPVTCCAPAPACCPTNHCHVCTTDAVEGDVAATSAPHGFRTVSFRR
jgi:hypothetical protein